MQTTLLLDEKILKLVPSAKEVPKLSGGVERCMLLSSWLTAYRHTHTFARTYVYIHIGNYLSMRL